MALFEVKHGDTRPSLIATLSDASEDPLDLTAVASALLHLVQGEVSLSRPLVIIDPPTAGRVRYDWTAEDWETLAIGAVRAEFELTYLDGNILTVPTRGYATVTVREALA